jgi:aconitate hydratase
MGVLPLQFAQGDGVQTLGLTGEELFAIEGVADAVRAVEGGDSQRRLRVRAEHASGAGASTSAPSTVQFEALVRIDTPREAEYFRHGGILQYVLRALLSR